MFIRSKLADDKVVGAAVGVGLILLAAVAIAYQFWPQKKPNLAQAYYTDDDGATWFADSAYKVAPFDHDGKTAVIAEVYSYDGGSKKFCAYVAKYTPDAKKKLEGAIADAMAKGQSPGSIALFNDRAFLNGGMMVKHAGKGNWIPYNDPSATDVFSIHAPDGTAVDEVFVY
jgi:hypothetical protein